MKNKFLKFSKWTLYIFLLFLLVLLLYIFYLDFYMGVEETYEISPWIMLPFLISGCLMFVCTAINYVLCIVEKIRNKDIQFWKNYLISIVIVGIIFTFMKWEQQNLLATWVGAVVTMSAVKAGEYMFTKHE